jgi:hypothetical protein
MKLITLFMVLLILASPCQALDEWDKTEIGMEIVYVGLHIVDWGQTLDIENHPGLHENNPILGKHPSRGKINAMFATGLILQPIIAHYAPDIGGLAEDITGLDLGSKHWRKAWIGSGIMIEAGCVANNIHVGIGASF